MNPSTTSPYRSAIRWGIVWQVVALVLTGFIDGNDIFLAFAAPAWILFWITALVFKRLRASPTRPELVVLRFGPLLIFVTVFVAGQYL
jgi:hypothetical protein